jgi:hypothetical protein
MLNEVEDEEDFEGEDRANKTWFLLMLVTFAEKNTLNGADGEN